jgi:hypothetical protein
MLAVVSAVVAFDRWPNGNVNARVKTLVLNDKPALIRVSATATGTPAIPPAVASALAAAPHATAGAPLQLGRPITGGRPGKPGVPGAPGPAKPQAPAATDPLAPVQDTTDPLIDTISNPGTTTGAVADGAQSVTDSAGLSLARISPQLGGTVATVGQSAAQTVRELPLPHHVLPGH